MHARNKLPAKLHRFFHAMILVSIHKMHESILSYDSFGLKECYLMTADKERIHLP